MEMDKMQVVWKNQKELRCGYTTGRCPGAGAKAAAAMLFSGEEIRQVSLMTPKGIELYLEVEKIQRENESVSCAIQKDSGDDPDVTNGLLVFARVKKEKGTADTAFYEGNLSLDGGVGVGRITHPGLEQKVGQAAINQIPRKMIFDAVREICLQKGYQGELSVEISIPEGEDVAKKTFNPRLGIRGGISVLGTSGIVEPMSEKALTDTIYLEMKMLRSSGYERCYIVPGNYGMDFLTEQLELDAELTVKCSNYVGEAIEDARLLGMKGILLIGHVGKWVKLAAGVMNTHSRQADCRMEVLAVHAAMQGADRESVCRIMQCLNTTEALKTIRQLGILEQVMASVMERIDFYLSGRAGGEFEIGAIMFSNEDGILGKTPNAEQLLEQIQNERKQK